MANQRVVEPDAPDVETVFRALADPTRRRVIERLGHAPRSTSELAAEFDMAMPSFLGHLRTLEDCGLVSSHKQGRVRTYRLTPGPLMHAADWLDAQRELWERRLDQLDDYLTTLRDEEDT
jgi:DNA-binding transcriptional ArsR family regulator